MSPRVNEIKYDYPLPGSGGREWFRYRIVTIDGQVADFTVQYETLVDGKYLPVVRYDCAHGFAHRDLLDREGNPRAPKQAIGQQLSLDDALQMAERDLMQHWQYYRRDF